MTGKECAQKIKDDLKEKVALLEEKPKLVVFQIGNEEASNVYVHNKKRACEEVGMLCDVRKYDSITEEKLLIEIEQCNQDPLISGILVQLPLPNLFHEETIMNAIVPWKDVDGLTVFNQGCFVKRQEGMLPCTPKGIVKLLEMNHIDIFSKNVVIVGRSNLVGIPLAHLLLSKNATVTICHSKTKELSFYTRQADILIVAIGKANYIKADMVKEGAVVIDVGINRIDGKLYGDVAYDEVAPKCSYITPVPGGVGPMTIASLLENVYLCKEKSR